MEKYPRFPGKLTKVIHHSGQWGLTTSEEGTKVRTVRKIVFEKEEIC
jgi:hypothetical protein